MKKTLLTALLIAMSVYCTHAQTFPPDWSARFQAVLDSLTHQGSLLTNAGDTVGVSMAISVPGIGTWEGVSGPAVPGTPLTTDMTLGIGSNSKLFTSVIMLKLQENGVLSLDDHIGHWLHTTMHDVDTSATIRQCLRHETGIFDAFNNRPSWLDDVFADPSAFWTYSRVLDSIGAPHFAAGHGFRYSNTGYVLCAWIIEQATGQSYSDNLHQYITTPLNLTRTFDAATDTTALNQGPESYGEAFGVWYPRLGSVALSSMFRGAGSIVSTPKDVCAFYQAVFNSSFLSESSRQQLLDIEPASEYGLGIWSFQSLSIGTPIYYHSGDVAGFHSQTFFDRTTGASLFFVVNSYDADANNYRTGIRNVYTSHFPRTANDAGVSRITAPQGTICNSSISPAVVLTNFGSSALTSTTIDYRIDGGTINSYSWTGGLGTGLSTQVNLPAITVTNGRHNLEAWTLDPNGNTEGHTYNDTMRETFRANLVTAYNGYFSEDFESDTTPVLVWNKNNYMPDQWGITKLTGQSSMHSLARDCYDQGVIGDVSNVDIPVVHLISGTSPELKFSYAYSFVSGSNDSLEALISTDCGGSWASLFHKGGLGLSLGDTAVDIYFPQTSSEWHTITIPLTSYSGDALVRFRQYNSIGNNIYLDNISVGSQTQQNVATINTPEVTIYPNPAYQNIAITGLPIGTSFTLTNITGQRLFQTKTTNANTVIDISQLSSGVYLLSSDFGTKKFVKM